MRREERQLVTRRRRMWIVGHEGARRAACAAGCTHCCCGDKELQPMATDGSARLLAGPPMGTLRSPAEPAPSTAKQTHVQLLLGHLLLQHLFLRLAQLLSNHRLARLGGAKGVLQLGTAGESRRRHMSAGGKGAWRPQARRSLAVPHGVQSCAPPRASAPPDRLCRGCIKLGRARGVSARSVSCETLVLATCPAAGIRQAAPSKREHTSTCSPPWPGGLGAPHRCAWRPHRRAA